MDTVTDSVMELRERTIATLREAAAHYHRSREQGLTPEARDVAKRRASETMSHQRALCASLAKLPATDADDEMAFTIQVLEVFDTTIETRALSHSLTPAEAEEVGLLSSTERSAYHEARRAGGLGHRLGIRAAHRGKRISRPNVSSAAVALEELTKMQQQSPNTDTTKGHQK